MSHKKGTNTPHDLAWGNSPFVLLGENNLQENWETARSNRGLDHYGESPYANNLKISHGEEQAEAHEEG